MSGSRAARRQLAAAVRGGVLLGGGAIITNHVKRVRNRDGNPLLCCHGPCQKDGDRRFRISVKHERNDGTNVVYIFCSELCRREFAKDTRYEQYL